MSNTTFAWLLEFVRRDGDVGGPFYVGCDGFVTDDPHKARRFNTKEAADEHLNAVRVLRCVRPVEHGFWQTLDTECPHCGGGHVLPSGRCDHCNLRPNEPGYRTSDG